MSDLWAESPAAVAEVMMQRALTALENCPTSEPITQSYVVLGELAWDDCCGVLAAAPGRVYKSASFPDEARDITNCDASELAVEIVVMLLRCAPTIDDLGNMPTPDQMGAAFSAVARDAALIFDAMQAPMPPGWERANLDQTFDGADGGCIVVATTMTVGLSQTDWCVNCA